MTQPVVPDIRTTLQTIAGASTVFVEPVVTRLKKSQRGDPWRILVSTLLSLRTRDETTEVAQEKLFAAGGDTPPGLLALTEEEIGELIYPVGFWRRKAANLRVVAEWILAEHAGAVPDDLDVLLKLPGVGRKTANLVITEGFDKPGICVDTHVHRIMNRFGFVQTKTPDDTEMALREKLPADLWNPVNAILVTWGQNICQPVSPRCSQCPVEPECPQHGVKKKR